MTHLTSSATDLASVRGSARTEHRTALILYALRVDVTTLRAASFPRWRTDRTTLTGREIALLIRGAALIAALTRRWAGGAAIV